MVKSLILQHVVCKRIRRGRSNGKIYAMTQSRSRLVRLLTSPILLLVLFSCAFVGIAVPDNARLSPFDEYVYLDYLAKVPSQVFVHTGEETGSTAREAIACRGIVNYGTYGDSCGSSTYASDDLYPYDGKTGADIYTPGYFAATWALAQPLVALGVGLLDAGRLVGMLWLSLGTTLLFTLMRMLRVATPIALGLSLAVIATPAVFWSATYISTDAPVLAFASALGIVGVAGARRRLPLLVLPVLAVVAVLFKVQNLAAVGIVCAALFLYRIVVAFRADPDSPGTTFGHRLGRVLTDPAIWMSLFTVALAAAAQVAWLLFRAGEALRGSDGAIVDHVQKELSTGALFTEAFRFLFAVGAGGTSPTVVGPIVLACLSALAVAAMLGTLLKPGGIPASTVVIAGVTLGVALLMGPALSAATSIVAGYYVPLPARYGIVLLPAFVVCIGLYVNSVGKRGGVVIGGLGAVCALLAVLT